MLAHSLRSHQLILKLPKLWIVVFLQRPHESRRGDMIEDRIAMRNKRKLHVIARAKGIDLFLILSHFLADLLKILSVHWTSFFYFITHNKGFISASIKPNTGELGWMGKRMEDRNKLVNNRLVGNAR